MSLDYLVVHTVERYSAFDPFEDTESSTLLYEVCNSVSCCAPFDPSEDTERYQMCE